MNKTIPILIINHFLNYKRKKKNMMMKINHVEETNDVTVAIFDLRESPSLMELTATDFQI